MVAWRHGIPVAVPATTFLSKTVRPVFCEAASPVFVATSRENVEETGATCARCARVGRTSAGRAVVVFPIVSSQTARTTFTQGITCWRAWTECVASEAYAATSAGKGAIASAATATSLALAFADAARRCEPDAACGFRSAGCIASAVSAICPAPAVAACRFETACSASATECCGDGGATFRG